MALMLGSSESNERRRVLAVDLSDMNYADDAGLERFLELISRGESITGCSRFMAAAFGTGHAGP
jgi:hypothetical protein